MYQELICSSPVHRSNPCHCQTVHPQPSLLHSQRAYHTSTNISAHLPETLLPRPHRGVNDLEEELSRARVEDEDGSVDGLGGQVAFKRLGKEGGIRQNSILMEFN